MLLMALLIGLFTSCLKEGPPPPPVSGLLVVDASPGSPPLNFFLNNNQVNSGLFSYSNTLGYFNAFSGIRAPTIYNSSTGAKLASTSVTLVENNFYSLFITDLPNNIGFLLIPDSLSAPASGQAEIRFVHLGPDAPAVDFAVKNGSVLFSNKSYKSYTNFVSIPGDSTYTFNINATGTSTPIATATSIKIEKNAVYTIWLKGLINTTTDSLKIGTSLITNAWY